MKLFAGKLLTNPEKENNAEFDVSNPQKEPSQIIDPYMDADLLQFEYEEELQKKLAEAKGLEREEKEKLSSPEKKQTVSKKIQSRVTTSSNEASLHVHVQDMLRLDRNGRTILHRAALDQNMDLVKDLCLSAETKIDNYVVEFIDKPDKFGNTPLLNACTENNDHSYIRRGKCIEILLQARANPNIRSKNTLWTPLTWCAYYGDVASIKSLLQAGAHAFWPDHKGLYPLDYYGLQSKRHSGGGKNVAKELITNLKDILLDFEREKGFPEVLEPKYIQTDRYRFLQLPLLRSSLLYWSIYFQLDKDEFIIPLLKMDNVYPEMPLLSPGMKNCFHSCCTVGNIEALKLLFESEVVQKRYQKIMSQKTVVFNFLFNAQGQNPLNKSSKNFELTKEEKKDKLYSQTFINYIKEMVKWISGFESRIVRHTLNSQEKTSILPYYEAQDNFGNTPLHIASVRGYVEIVKYLLSQNVKTEIENHEGWRCEELIQHEPVKKAYKDHIEKKFMQATDDESNSIARVFGGNFKKAATLDSRKLNSQLHKALRQAIYYYKQERVIPDVVLVFKANNAAHNKKSNAIINRVNFNISLIQSSFSCYLAPALDNTLFHLMIKMSDKQLEKECVGNGIKLKLRNDYSYQTFDQSRKVEFEPFRSRQRQEITLTSLNRLVDIEQLKDLHVLDDIYLMHTVSGLNKISNVWSWSKWLPQPLSSYKDYFQEGKHLNFSNITVLKTYFGEKYSFYFAWMSFYICHLPILAVPGLAVYILTKVNPNTMNVALPIWVTYNSLIMTLLVERWKRKSAEIATRWGTIDLEKKQHDDQIRKEYSGDEIISVTTGSLTKFNPKNPIIRYNIASLLVLLFLCACVVASFYWIEELKDANPEWSAGSKTFVSVVNGIVIALANFIYEFVARYFVGKENHKYDTSHEKSLILRIAISKMLNSYIGVFYLTFIKQESLDNQFYTLLSLLIVKQITSGLGSMLLPYFLYKVNETAYFRKLEQKATIQCSLKRNETNDENIVLKTPVLDCKTGRPSRSEWELNQVELNSLRIQKVDILDYYGDILIQFGYITMFSPAFALGPIIALVANLLDIRLKIFAYLHFFKRPAAQKAGGIGHWLDVWEIVSIISIFVNALSLFFNLDFTIDFLENLFDSNHEYEDPDFNIKRLWVFVIVVHVILVLKYIVRAFINDRPDWVVKQEEKQEFDEEIALSKKLARENKAKTKALSVSRDGNRKETQTKIKQEKKVKTKILDNSQIQKGETKPREEQDSYQQLPTHRSKETREVSIISPNESILAMSPTKLDFKLNKSIKAILHNTFILMEKELITRRIADINKLTEKLISICNHCQKAKSTLNCLTCQEQFCSHCYETIHNKVVLSAHDIVPFDESDSKETQDSAPNSETNTGLIANILEDKSEEKRVSWGPWRKFETFNFPLIKSSPSFYTLKVAYNVLFKFYITDNGITKNNQIENIEKPLKFLSYNNTQHVASGLSLYAANQTAQTENEKELNGVLDLTYENEVNQILNLEAFNVEDKILINRVIFLTLKRRGAKATFEDFSKKLKILEEGSFESKLFLIFDLMDQDDDGYVSRDELHQTLKLSFIQNISSNNKIDEVLGDLFQKSNKISKKDVFQVVLKNPKLFTLFAAYTQTRQ